MMNGGALFPFPAKKYVRIVEIVPVLGWLVGLDARVYVYVSRWV